MVSGVKGLQLANIRLEVRKNFLELGLCAAATWSQCAMGGGPGMVPLFLSHFLLCHFLSYMVFIISPGPSLTPARLRVTLNLSHSPYLEKPSSAILP